MTPNSSLSGACFSPNHACSDILFASRRSGRSAEKSATVNGSVAGFHTASSMPFRMPLSTAARMRNRPSMPMPPAGVHISAA